MIRVCSLKFYIWEINIGSGNGLVLSYNKPLLNSSPPRQNGRHFADDTFKCNFVNEIFGILIKISLKFVPKGPIDNDPALVKLWLGAK